jgi:DNA-binding transcriptional MerR regulator
MSNTTQPTSSVPPTLFRIGAVAKLTGIPVSTLRIWEVRHHAFSPTKTAGKHRLYSQHDVHKAGLLKQLSKSGYAISAIAALEAAALEKLPSPGAAAPQAATGRAGGTVSLAVVGSGIAGRIASGRFTHQLRGVTLRVTDCFPNLAQACAADFQEKPQMLLVRVNTLQPNICTQIQALARQHGVLQTVLVYGFAQEAVVQTLRAAGILVRRAPVSDFELSDLISSVIWVGAAKTPDGAQADTLIPARKYSDETLTRVAGISTDMQCECPRHVAELIAQLVGFEQYSQECLNKTGKDAQLHARLHAISGSARALFEHALEMVAEHENINLAAPSP